MEVTIKKILDTKDLKEALAIRNEVFTIEKGVPKDIEVDWLDNLNTNCDHFLIIYKENNVGAFRCYKIDDDTVKIQRFCLLSKYRHLGIGREVLNKLTSYYQKEDKKKIILDAKYSVYPFYEKSGYKKVSDIFIEAGIEHVKMEKDI